MSSMPINQNNFETAVTEEMIDGVQLFIEDEPHMTY